MRLKRVSREEILSGNLWKVIIGLSVPIILNSLIQTMYNLTDSYWLGTLGTNQMAAITLVTPVQNIVLGFGLGITTAGSILISQYLGAKEDAGAKDMLRHIFLCSMIFSAVCAGAIYMATGSICGWMGAGGDVYTHSKTYLQIVIWDMPFLYGVNLYTAARQSQGDTVRPMFLNVAGVVLNMILDPLFMLTFDMGVAGAALATLLSKLLCSVFALASLRSSKELLRLDFKGFKFDIHKVKDILRVGLPAAFGSSMINLGMIILAKNVNDYGAAATAAYGIGNKINGIIATPALAVGSAVATVVGQNIGAGQRDRAEQGYKLARNMSVVFLLIGGVILYIEPVARSVVSIFLHDEHPIQLAMDYLRLLAISCFSNGIYNCTNSLFQATGHTMITMVVGGSRLLVWRFIVLYICEKHLNMGIASIWWAVIMSNYIATGIIYVLYRMGLWKKVVIKVKG